METTEQIVNEKVEAFRLQLLKELVKPEFEVGKWYTYTDSKNHFVCFTDSVKREGYGLVHGAWYDSDIWDKQNITLATESEVLEALTKEYHKRGYERGYFKGVEDNKITNCWHVDDILLSEGGLWVRGCGFAFKDGKWATVIPKEKTSEDWVLDFNNECNYASSLHNFLKENNLSITKNK